MPDLHLTICGPVDREPEFARAYARELALPNVTRKGWIDVGGEDFRKLLDDSVALVYPSCAEGQAGAAVNCIRAGLIPLLSSRSGVDVGEFGMLLGQCSVDEVCEVVTRVAAMPAEELYARSRAAWAFGQEQFSSDAYSRRYGQILERIELMREQKGDAA